MLAAIDQGAPNSVYVMVVEDGADIAGMGGLMGTAMSARNFSEPSLMAECAMLLTCRRLVFRCTRWGSCLPLQSALPFRRIKYPCRL